MKKGKAFSLFFQDDDTKKKFSQKTELLFHLASFYVASI